MAFDEGKHGVMLGYEPVFDIPFTSDEAFSSIFHVQNSYAKDLGYGYYKFGSF